MSKKAKSRTEDDELWLRACVKIAIEEMEKSEEGIFVRDLGLVQFVLFLADECAEVVWS